MVQGVAGIEAGEVDGGPHAGSKDKGLGPIIRSVLQGKNRQKEEEPSSSAFPSCLRM